VGVRVQEVGLDNAPFRPTGSPGAGHSGLSGQFRKKCVVLSVVECGESARGNQVRVCVCVCVCVTYGNMPPPPAARQRSGEARRTMR